VNSILTAPEDVDAIERAIYGVHSAMKNKNMAAGDAVTLVESLRQVSTDEVPKILASTLALYAPLFLGSKWTSLSPARRAAIAVLLVPSANTFDKLRNAVARLGELETKRVLEAAEITNLCLMHDEGKEQGGNQLVLLIYFKGVPRRTHAHTPPPNPHAHACDASAPSVSAPTAVCAVVPR
jgi:hypothetical protein